MWKHGEEEERERLKKIDNSFTVRRQSDGTILRSAENKPRYYSECGRRNAENKQLTSHFLSNNQAVKLQICGVFSFISSGNTRILIPEHDLEMGSRSQRLCPVKLLPPPLPPGQQALAFAAMRT